jgi:hypothetical protein
VSERENRGAVVGGLPLPPAPRARVADPLKAHARLAAIDSAETG